PTAMKPGVSRLPCGVLITPRRAAPSSAKTRNSNPLMGEFRPDGGTRTPQAGLSQAQEDQRPQRPALDDRQLAREPPQDPRARLHDAGDQEPAPAAGRGDPSRRPDPLLRHGADGIRRSEERRVGKECRSWWYP